MRNHLHSLAQVIAAPLFGDNLLVETPCSPIVIARKFGVGEAFVVAQVEIGFGAVVGHEHLAMLKRRHRPRIDIEIGIELAKADIIAPRLEQRAERCRSKTLAERGDHAAGDEDVPRHGPLI